MKESGLQIVRQSFSVVAYSGGIAFSIATAFVCAIWNNAARAADAPKTLDPSKQTQGSSRSGEIFPKPAATGGASSTWQLYQTCGVLGDHDVFVSNKGIKIIDRSFGLITVSSSPDWTVTTYDTNSKTYSQTPLRAQKTYIPEKEFTVTGRRWVNLVLDKELQPIEVAKTPAQGYVTPPTFSQKQFKDREQESADMQFVASANYCEAKNIAVPKEVGQILSTHYALPNKGGVPLQFRYHDLGGYFHNWLVTSSVQAVAAVDLKPPVVAGFQKLATASDIRVLAINNAAKAKEAKKKRPLL